MAEVIEMYQGIPSDWVYHRGDIYIANLNPYHRVAAGAGGGGAGGGGICHPRLFAAQAIRIM